VSLVRYPVRLLRPQVGISRASPQVRRSCGFERLELPRASIRSVHSALTALLVLGGVMLRKIDTAFVRRRYLLSMSPVRAEPKVMQERQYRNPYGRGGRAWRFTVRWGKETEPRGAHEHARVLCGRLRRPLRWQQSSPCREQRLALVGKARGTEETA
jgi:hypothetical protein